jgi:hypothetical protein
MTGVSPNYSPSQSGNNWPKIWNRVVAEKREKKNIARLASGFIFLLAKSEFYLQLASGYLDPLL